MDIPPVSPAPHDNSLQTELDIARHELERTRAELAQAQQALEAARQDRSQLNDLIERERAHFHSVFEGLGEGLLITDLDDRILYANERITQMCGYNCEEIVGRIAYEVLLPREEWPELHGRNERRAQGHSDVYETQIQRKSGERFWALVHATPLRDADGKIVGTIGAQIDISERKETELALKRSEARLQGVVKHAVDGFIVQNSQGRILDVNPQECEMLGYSREELLSMNVRDVAVSFPGERVAKNWDNFQKSERPMIINARHKKRDGTIFPVEIRLGPVQWDGEPAVLALIRDVSEAEAHEAARRELEARFQTVVAAASDAIVLADEDGQIVLWNSGAQKTFGWSPEEALGRNVMSLMPQRFHELHRAGLERVSQGGDFELGGHVLSLSGLHRAGYEFPIEMTLGVWRDCKYTFFASVIRDVSERERLERELRDALRERHLIMEAVPDVLFRLDLNGNLVGWNRELERVTGLSSDLLQNRPALDFFDPIHHEAVGGAIKRALQGDHVGVEAPLLHRDGTSTPFSFSSVPMHDAEGTLLGLAGTGHDITERLKTEEQTRLALHEKEVLLKEIHHRVKNNLQIINSLLSMQGDALNDKRIRAALADAQNRVRAMGLIHETLYLAGNLGRIDMHSYCSRLTSALLRGYGEAAPGVEIVLDVPGDLYLPLDAAVPCGLIINELITNSFKYAFPDKRKGIISVAVSLADDVYWTLRVGDNGVGMPEFDIDRVSSTGLQLVTGLCDQLEATYRVDRSGGTEWTISFKST